jgi:hypothetical protein
MGNISQILEEFTKARIYYIQLTKSKSADIKLRQFSAFQLAEVNMNIIEKKEPEKLTKYIYKYVLDELDKAIAIDDQSDLVNEIKARKLELMIKHGLHPYYLVNGRNIPEKPYYLSLSQKINFDNNITLATDSASTASATKLESFILDSNINASYRMVFKRRYIIEPELWINHLYHTDQVHSNVYKNDSYTISPAIRTKFEHKFKEKPASFLFDIEHSYIERDRLEAHTKTFYSRSFTYIIGDRFRFFDSGDTTIKFKFKNYRGYSTSIDNDTLSFSIDQIFIRNNGHFVILLYQSDLIDNYNDPSVSSDSHLFRLDYIWPEIYPDYTLNMALAVILLDTKAQSDTRGMEITTSPSFKLTKKINDQIKLKISYEYTKNTSKDKENYTYTKQVSGFEFIYIF